ncbi:MAG TPA: hypothetical protein VML75_28290, partial [Kofleriaceae bacterium]|nr:hypothetical protein [Kofleriaceae bacterium]
MAVAAPEPGVLLEQALLDVEAESLRLVVAVLAVQVLERIAVDLAVGEQHLVERLPPVLGAGVEDLLRPDLVGGEALGELDRLPEIGARFAGCCDQLVPELGAALGVAVGALLLDPHRGRQD